MDIRDKIKLQFADDFFREEIRCGYKVTEKAKKIWAIELDLLNELIRVCDKHHIKVTLFAGTLLGAIRHKGMIPWDDDIDVALTREEYEKLCKVAPREFRHPYFFQNNESDPQYLFGYSRLRNSLTTGYIVGYDSLNYNNGIYIDIFVLDGYIEDESLLKKQLRKKSHLETIAELYKRNIFSHKILKRIIKKTLIILISPILFKLVNYRKLTIKYEETLKRYNNKTHRVSLITHNYDFIRRYWCNKEDFSEITHVPFENIMVPAPVKYDAMLKHMYGDYMKFPPVEKRGAWHEGVLELDPDIPYKEYIDKRNSKG